MFTKRLFPAITNYSSVILKSTPRINLLAVNSDINASPNIDLVRYAARKGTRAAALAAKKARKLLQANEPPPIPKHLLRKIKISTEFQRRRCTDENWLETEPIDDVWNMKLYRGKPYSVAEAVKMHRESHDPTMLNDPTALLYANIELDLKQKKKDRYLAEFNGILIYPNEFEFIKKNRIIVICKSEEDQVKAIDAGAQSAGSTALIKQILSGVVASEDFDYVICHPDMYKELSALRGILKRKYPNTHNGLLRIDIDNAVKSFVRGVEYNLKCSSVEPDFGWVDLCFGRLNMSIEHLEENLKHGLKTIEGYKPTGTSHILFIIRTLLWCEKSREKFKIPHWEYLPNYPENGVLLPDDTEPEEVASESQSVETA